jgi:hypothetical protein
MAEILLKLVLNTNQSINQSMKVIPQRSIEKYTAVQKRVIEHKSMYFFFEFIEKMIEVNI